MNFSDFEAFDDNENGYWQEPDVVLTSIVSTFVNIMDMPIGVTLFVKGMVISGTLVSEREYLKRLSAAFTDMAKRAIQPKTKKEREAVEEMFNFQELEEGWYPDSDDDDENIENADEIVDQDAAPEDEASGENEFELPFDPEQVPPMIRHLHLTDVSIVTPQPTITFGEGPMPYMRLRLTMVDGWILGHSTPFDGFEPFASDDGNDSGTILH